MTPNRPLNLAVAATEFAAQLSDTLNGTVTDGVRLSAVPVPAKKMVYVGAGVGRQDLTPRTGFRLRRADGRPAVYMLVSYRLRADDEHSYLTVQNSVVALALDQNMGHELMHVDYERDKPNDYPEAHLQLVATSDEWKRLSPGKPLERLHLPVGPRRFRPSLEDVIEFLIREGLADGRNGWRDIVDTRREAFQLLQLRAAIRRHPDVAREALADFTD